MADRLLRELGHSLRAARKRERRSGAALASRAGVSQPTVSRVENGQRVASVQAVERLIAALSFSPEEAERLTSMARDAYALTSSEKRVDAGVSLVPGVGRKLLTSASVVHGFQDAMVPALLRVPEYATAAGGGAGSSADWGKVPVDDGKTFRFVVTESALRTWPGSGAFMPAQLAHLLDLAQRPDVTLGVIPWGVGLPVMPPHGFTVCDEAGVLVETFTAEMTLNGPDHVTPYREAFAALEAVAVTGDDFRAVVDGVSADLAKIIQ
ncbi:Scr1 family TA system antitoxin-like transcriptional regulator [Nocardiopsis aegyptia]|uniref:Transcriptional regulator with XRE-family HTH domain n=1 Tax=Nocardiopsis aegyptia TaxID=220378 RepID=A0A7Z0JB76_9ACTN|nr:Scr1 family TA system antitoxin-like transcriptional regulator [Nocardiopsis aegyptia]NYJ35175.1 transcriptional regulator with XRE-family HTH domain [Nocardiopsis aegyptia]